MTFILVAAGIFTIYVGKQAIDTQAFEWSSRKSSSFSVGPIGVSGGTSEKKHLVTGSDATWIGAGLSIFGLLLLMCGAVVGYNALPSVIKRLIGPNRSGVIAIVCLFFLCQTASVVCIFRPWNVLRDPSAAGFWTMEAIFLFVALLIATNRFPTAWRRFVGPATVLLFIIVLYLSDSAGVGMVLGFFAGFFYLLYGVALHAALWPDDIQTAPLTAS